ncbi:hypothetical protein SAMN06297251_10127 [Fulvimarina manganoxydans]|uniref:Uncharacterized protein n=1 Tax=Fulvimarina manganoxydans TaxID=937218 RepID=A0A1W1Y9A0_9HYPH|nr:hypothetical protein SAMN06297251_10127 [Fulvimarina manganoxydans]
MLPEFVAFVVLAPAVAGFLFMRKCAPSKGIDW